MANLIWYDSTEAGAPVLNNVAGSFLEVLRACLVTGFNSKTVTSISVSAGVATVNCTGHGFTTAYRKLVLIEGCDEPLLNGNNQPTSVAVDTFTFSTSGVADGVYGGTITVKRGSLGWSEEYTGVHAAIFKRNDVAATENMLRVLDTMTAPATTTSAHVFMVDSASDIDTYVNKVPANNTYCTWGRGANTSTASTWAVVGDSKRVWVMASNSSPVSYSGQHMYFFGDIETLRTADTNGCFIVGHTSTNTSTNSSGIASQITTLLYSFSINGDTASHFSKKYDGTVIGPNASWLGASIATSAGYPSAIAYPTIMVGPYYLIDSEGLRGRFQLYLSSTYQPHDHLAIVQPDNVSEKYLAIQLNRGTSSPSTVPMVYIKLDGW